MNPQSNLIPEIAERKVIISGKVFLYRQKEPFVLSGVSVMGGLEFDEPSQRVRCHECGRWFASLAGHIWGTHHMEVRAYKLKHGLNIQSALCNETIRQRLIEHGKSHEAVLRGAVAGLAHAGMNATALHNHSRMGVAVLKMEKRNVNRSCKAQLLQRLRELGLGLGRTPTRPEMRRAGIGPQSMEHAFSLPLKEIMPLAGLLPQRPRARYNKVLLAELMTDFWVKFQRLPSQSDYRRGLLPSLKTYRRHFGSTLNAYFCAGLETAHKMARARAVG